MGGTMPISLGLSDAGARAVGQQVATGLTPVVNVLTIPLNRLGRQLDVLGNQLMNGFVQLTLLLGSLQQVRFGIPVSVTNLAALETMTFGLLVLSLLDFLVLVLIFARLGSIAGGVFQLHTDLGVIHGDLIVLTFLTTQMLGVTVILLGQILAELRKGLKLDGVVTVNVVISGIPSLDLGKLLGLLGIALGALALLAAALALIVLFVAGLGLALTLFTPLSLAALAAVGLFTAAMVALMTTISKFTLPELGRIALGFGIIAAFVALLGLALKLFNEEALKVMGPLGDLLKKLSDFATVFAGFKLEQVGAMALGFLALAGFVALLGFALRAFNADAVALMGPLGDLLKKLSDFATVFANFKLEQVGAMALGFLALAGFVALLGFAMRAFNDDAVALMGPLGDLLKKLSDFATVFANFDLAQVGAMALGFLVLAAFVALLGFALRAFGDDAVSIMGPLGDLLTSLGNLATTLAGFDLGQILAMAAGFLLIAGFVALLGLALDVFSASAIAALPGLSQLLDSLTNLTVTLAGLEPGQLLTMGIALTLLVAAVWAIAAAIDFATPGLVALAAVLAEINAMFASVAAAARAFASVISSLPSMPSFPSFQSGGTIDHTGLAMLHEGERVLTRGETQMMDGHQAAPDPTGDAPGAPGMGAAAPHSVDQSINVGGVTLNIHTDKVDAHSAELLSDEVVRKIQEKLSALHTEQHFRNGVRAPA